MQLKFLGDLELAYTRLDYADFGSGGHYVGVLEGRLTGDRLAGDVFLVNSPPKRPDNVNLPALSGTITTAEGVKVFAQFNGISLLREDRRHFVTSVVLRCGDDRYAWLNQVFGVMEGVLKPDEHAVAKLHLCEPTIKVPA
jgi:hypothetical protein